MEPRNVATWVGLLALYLAYTLIHGAITGWYPYPFVNPAKACGYGGVAVWSIGVGAFYALTGAGLVGLGNWHHGQVATTEPKAPRAGRA